MQRVQLLQSAKGKLTRKKRLVSRRAHVHPVCPSRFKYSHGGERSRAHGDVGKLVCGAMWMDGEKMGASCIHTPKDKGCTNMALISSECQLRKKKYR